MHPIQAKYVNGSECMRRCRDVVQLAIKSIATVQVTASVIRAQWLQANRCKRSVENTESAALPPAPVVLLRIPGPRSNFAIVKVHLTDAK